MENTNYWKVDRWVLGSLTESTEDTGEKMNIEHRTSNIECRMWKDKDKSKRLKD